MEYFVSTELILALLLSSGAGDEKKKDFILRKCVTSFPFQILPHRELPAQVFNLPGQNRCFKVCTEWQYVQYETLFSN